MIKEGIELNAYWDWVYKLFKLLVYSFSGEAHHSLGRVVEVARIELASKVISKRGSYVCSHIRASDGCEYFVKYTKPSGDLAWRPGTHVGFSFPTFPQRSLPTFCYRCRPLITCYNLVIRQRKRILHCCRI